MYRAVYIFDSRVVLKKNYLSFFTQLLEQLSPVQLRLLLQGRWQEDPFVARLFPLFNKGSESERAFLMARARTILRYLEAAQRPVLGFL